MNQIIFIPAPQQESWETRLNNASVQYSDDPRMQHAFRDGAKWESGGGGWEVFLLVLVIAYAIIQILVSGFGIVDAEDQPQKGKWIYVFPGYAAGQTIGKWLNK